MILSPAKTLDLTAFTTDVGTSIPDSCHAPEKTKTIAEFMKKQKESDLAKFLTLSKTLSKTAASYWQDFAVDSCSSNSNTKPCIFAFSGAAYQGLQISSCSDSELQYLQSCLRIVDPLYGLLRPLDAIQPYRLEMATKGLILESGSAKIKLAEYWKSAVTARLLDEFKDIDANNYKVLVNLASDEYLAAVDVSTLEKHGVTVLKVAFKEQGRVVSVHAKRARGLMAKYLAQCQAKSLDDIKRFQMEGYELQPEEEGDNTIVFDRIKNWKQVTQEGSSSRKKRKS